MAIPTLETVKAYLGESSWDDGQISSALAAETAAQARACRIPVEYPADLAEALCRRVARTLALRSLPLGLQVTLSDMNAAQTRVGGFDPEIGRLEGPFRLVVLT